MMKTITQKQHLEYATKIVDVMPRCKAKLLGRNMYCKPTTDEQTIEDEREEILRELPHTD
jgi:hypothetical protein